MTHADELGGVVRELLARHLSHDVAWAKLCAEVGVAGLMIAEEHGGAGAGLLEVHVVMHELGRELSPAPMLSVIVATQALSSCGEGGAHLLPRIADGSLLPAVVWDPYVLDAQRAGVLLVVDGDILYELDPGRATISRCVPMDLTRDLATVHFELSQARPLGPVDTGAVMAAACAALAAEQAGAAERALELTVEHTKTRVQFGRPLASFQALQHRLADLHVLVEAAKALAYAAASGQTHAAAARIYCTEALTRVAAEMIQMHGGIGITWEHSAHRYFKRAHGSAHLFGGTAAHLRRLGESLATA